MPPLLPGPRCCRRKTPPPPPLPGPLAQHSQSYPGAGTIDRNSAEKEFIPHTLKQYRPIMKEGNIAEEVLRERTTAFVR